ncbi:MAG: methylated-DNA--[protein]-cysteine S-methyltransferase [Pseudomonadota bacterium]
MSAPSEVVVPLGETGLTARLSIHGETVSSMRVESSGAAQGVPSTPCVEGVVAELCRWPEVAEGIDWVDERCFPPTGTAFQRAVWRILCGVSVGETATYGEVAAWVGHPRAARAVGQAVNANPWAPLVPCHRVLAAGGRPGGYAGGLEIKRRLLAAEGVTLPPGD